MSLSSRLAGALSFAHLAGVATRRGKASRADDDQLDDDDRDDDDQPDDDEDRQPGGKKGNRSRRAKNGKKGKRADDDDPDASDDDDPDADDDSDDPDADEDDPDDDDSEDQPAGRRARRAKRAESDDDPDAEDDDDEMHGKSAVARARRRERARCAAIFGSRQAARNPALAANLAFNTSMSRKQALAVLRDTPAGSPAAHGRADRNPQLGTDGGQNSSRDAKVASSWDQAMTKARGR